jgi:Divergent InlB B-repeat domain
MTANTLVTAMFTLNTYTLTVATAGNGSGTTSNTPPGTTFTYGTVVTVTATPVALSSFTGWSGDCSGTFQCVVTMTANKLITATFSTYFIYLPTVVNNLATASADIQVVTRDGLAASGDGPRR